MDLSRQYQGQNQAQTITGSTFLKMNLFFIKSKHVFRNFKNHDYFQNTRNHSFSYKAKKARQFVQEPAPYGFSNAYNYICTQASRNLLRKPSKRQNKTHTDFGLFQGTKQTFNGSLTETKRKSNLAFPNLVNSSNKRSQLSHDEILQNQLQVIKQKSVAKAQQFLSFLHISKSSLGQKWTNNEIKINIYPRIINTFLKSRINYYQMTENQFAVLKSFIVGIFETQKQYVEYKDMVNIRSMKEIFTILQSENYSQTYKKEMVRYFFIANKLTYQYQLNKLKDQMKTLISYKFSKDITKGEIYIYHTKTSTEITNLHELLKLQGKLIFGVDTKILNLYNGVILQKEAQNKLANRIKKWKSIVPQQIQRAQTFTSIPAEKYETLFNNVKKKRERFSKNKKKPEITLKNSQFIDRSKLCKNDDIFQ